MAFHLATRCLASSSRTLPPVVSRTFMASALVEAAAAKKKPQPKPAKKAAQGFAKGRAGGGKKGASGGSSSAAKIDGGAFAVAPALMGPAPELSADVIDYTPELCFQKDSANVGAKTRFSRRAIDAFDAFGLPRNISREFASTRIPTSVVRESTITVNKRLREAKSSRESSYLLTGSQGSGKSVVLLQAVASALADGWIVIYVPRAIQWIDSSSPYVYNTATRTFHQPVISASLLKSIGQVNKGALDAIKLSEEFKIGGQTFEDGSSLGALVEFGSRPENSSVEVLEKVMEVLAQQSGRRVLIAIDDVQALYRESAYRAPDFSLLQSYALSAPRLMLDYISGRKHLSSGSIMTAVSLSHPSCLPPVEMHAALPAFPSTRPITPFERLDEHHFAHAKALRVLPVGERLEKSEAHGMFTLWSQLGLVVKNSDEQFLGKYAESGGNAREFARGLSTSMAI